MRKAVLVTAFLAATVVVPAQHLIWKYPPSKTGYTCLFGEIQVLATGPTIYYCGCNWWPGNAAGGYTGIQDSGDHHNMIFSIWDTSKNLHPTVVQQEARAHANRFGGEGEGGHTHLDYNWKLGETYKYYATKTQDSKGENTLCTVYFYDDGLRSWVKEATISNPNGGFDSVKTFGGMLNSFLENWSGNERTKCKLASYNLWLGTTPWDLTEVTEASGDGKWGKLGSGFYLAEGEDGAVNELLHKFDTGPERWEVGAKASLTHQARKLSQSLARQLAKLK